VRSLVGSSIEPVSDASGAVHRCRTGYRCGSVPAPPLCRACREGAAADFAGTRDALAAKKAQGVKLGGLNAKGIQNRDEACYEVERAYRRFADGVR